MTNEEYRKLANAFLKGEDGMERNESKGWQYMRQAADGGDRQACADFARHCIRDMRDDALAAEYYERSGKKEEYYAYALLRLAGENPEKKGEYFKKAASCLSLTLGMYDYAPEIFCEFIEGAAVGAGFASIDGGTVRTYVRNLALIAERQPKTTDTLGKSVNAPSETAVSLLRKLLAVEEALGDGAPAVMGIDGWKAASVIADAAGEADGRAEYLARAEAAGYKLTDGEMLILGREKGYIYGEENFDNWFRKNPYGLDSYRFAPVKHSEEYARTLAEAQIEKHRDKIFQEIGALSGANATQLGEPQGALLYEPVFGVTKRMGKGYFAYTYSADRAYTYEGTGQVLHSKEEAVGSHDMYVSGFYSGYRNDYPADLGKPDTDATDETEHISGWEQAPQGGVRVDFNTTQTFLKECDGESRRKCIEKLDEEIMAWANNNSWAGVSKYYTAEASVNNFISQSEKKLSYMPFYYFTYEAGGALLTVRINAYSGGFRYAVCKADSGKSPVQLFNEKLAQRPSRPAYAPSSAAPAAQASTAGTKSKPARGSSGLSGKKIGIIVGCIVAGFVVACIVISEILNNINNKRNNTEDTAIVSVLE